MEQHRIIEAPAPSIEEEPQTLFDVLHACENIPTMVAINQRVVRDLTDAVDHAADSRLKESLQLQLNAADHSMLVLEEKLKWLTDALSKITVTYEDMNISGLDCYKTIKGVKNTIELMRQAKSMIRPLDFGIGRLRVKADLVGQVFGDAVTEYEKVMHGLVMVLKGVVISDDMEVVWKTALNTKVLILKWNANEWMWELPSEYSIRNEQLQRMMDDLNDQSEEKGGWPEGTEARLTIKRTGPKYKVSFEVCENDDSRTEPKVVQD